jgi:hypothetical protein
VIIKRLCEIINKELMKAGKIILSQIAFCAIENIKVPGFFISEVRFQAAKRSIICHIITF